MPKRDKRAFLRGVGSVMDLGGTTHRRPRFVRLKKGGFASDRRALARDFAATMAQIEGDAGARG